MTGKLKMSAKRLIIEMALALLLATFAMSLDDVHATAYQNLSNDQATCEQRLLALAEANAQTDNGPIEGRSISDESLSCGSTGGPVKAKNKKNDWLKLLP
jgi:hypothetical protein